jgi:hypothetical protein
MPWDEYARAEWDDNADPGPLGGADPSVNWPYYNQLIGLAGQNWQNFQPDSSNLSTSSPNNSPLDGSDWQSGVDNNGADLIQGGLGYLPLAARSPDGSSGAFDPAQPWLGANLDRNPWTPNTPLELTPLGNPANPRLRREWERQNGRPWPRDPNTGRNYDVAHKKALADGGTNTVDNIHPMHPDAHVAEHMANGDYSRWALRPGIARAFGGTVARSLDFLAIVPIITGVMSGRIRTDTTEHFLNDIAGVPSSDDPVEPLEA